MNFNAVKSGFIAAAVLSLSSVSISSAFADDDLFASDKMVTTIMVKSKIDGMVTSFDAATGNYHFDYSGGVYTFETNSNTGELKEIKKQIGTIQGTALFPVAFGDLAMGIREVMLQMEAYMNGVPGAVMPTMPEFPQVINWTCNDCVMTLGNSTFRPIAVANPALDNMGLTGRAFTGIGPVGMPSSNDVTVRMGGCATLAAVEGDYAGKVGTICLNSTVKFDISFETGTILGSGGSNCVIVLHDPLQM